VKTRKDGKGMPYPLGDRRWKQKENLQERRALGKFFPRRRGGGRKIGKNKDTAEIGSYAT